MVYFIQRESGGPIKIGYTKSNAKSRMRSLQTAHAEKLVLLATSDRHAEKDLHERFADLRLHGEWFRADVRLLAWIWAHASVTREGFTAMPKAWGK